jgi:hypothetical protein
MSVIQLNPPIPMITPKGEAYAHVLIDYGPEFHLLWVCFQDDTGECWTWPNPDVRAVKNVTMGRKSLSPFTDPGTPKPLRKIFPAPDSVPAE